MELSSSLATLSDCLLYLVEMRYTGLYRYTGIDKSIEYTLHVHAVQVGNVFERLFPMASTVQTTGGASVCVRSLSLVGEVVVSLAPATVEKWRRPWH